jgi:3-oxoacyl-[acyl-carrier protein] reductase
LRSKFNFDELTMQIINPMCLQGRTILVTGASSGIGRATAVLLSKLGARLVLVARDKDKLSEIESLLNNSENLIEVFNLSQVDEISDWLRVVALKVGGLHGLVHSAGVHLARPLRLVNEKSISDVFEVNVNAAIGLAKGFRQKSVCPSGGSIVFLSSVMGLVGQPGVSVYSASKGAIIALTKSLALELAREGIRVNCIAPGTVRTEMTENLEKSLTSEQFQAIELMHPLGLGRPVDVANGVAFLLAETGRWVTGSTLVIDGGYTAH